MFSFLNDPYVQVMLSLSRTKLSYEDEFKAAEYLSSIDFNKLFALCREHELDGIVGKKILKIGHSMLPKSWEDELHIQRTRQDFLKKTILYVASILISHDIKLIALKNGGIMVSIMDDPLDCPMGDIDLLVGKKDFMPAHKVLCKAGYIFEFRSEYEKPDIETAYSHGSSEYRFTYNDKEFMWMELSWRPIDGRWICKQFEPNTEDLFSRAVKVKNSDVYVLKPEDNLLQVCAHTAKHSFVRAPGLRLHLDVDRIVTHCQIDWNGFIDLVKKSHLRTATYFSLYIPFMLFGTNIPKKVFLEFKPNFIKHKLLTMLLSKAGLLYPNKCKFSKIEFLTFQIALYDCWKDLVKVIYPGDTKMKELYRYKSSWKTPFFVIVHILDLIGIRRENHDIM